MTSSSACVNVSCHTFLLIFPILQICRVFPVVCGRNCRWQGHDKPTNHDSRRCGLPGDGVLSRCLAAPAHTATLSRSCIGSLRIQSVLMFRSTVTEGSGICLGRQFGRCPELNASRSLRRISQRRYFCVQLPPRQNLFSTHQTPTAEAFLPRLSLWIVRHGIARASTVRQYAE